MKRFFYLFILALTLCSCGEYVLVTPPPAPTRGSTYPKMYEEKPVSLLIMPPINYSSNVEAKDLLYTSISRPLIDAGYYVIPTLFSMDILRAESAYDSELFVDRPLDDFRVVFGADAVVFSEIKSWKKVGVGIQTCIRYFIKSTHSGEILFDKTSDIFLDTSVGVDVGDSLLGALISVAATAANTAMTDHIEAARLANQKIFNDIPRGRYDSSYLQDQNVPVNNSDQKSAAQSYKDQVQELKDAGGAIITIGDNVYKRAPKS